MQKILQWPSLVPADVQVGLHPCYGDYGHQHFKQPESLGLQVRLLTEVAAAARRMVSFVSFTMPQYQQDEAYFAPLAGLAADPSTELNFALVPYHPAEQAPGTTAAQVRLIDAALAQKALAAAGRGECPPSAGWDAWSEGRLRGSWTCTGRSSALRCQTPRR